MSLRLPRGHCPPSIIHLSQGSIVESLVKKYSQLTNISVYGVYANISLSIEIAKKVFLAIDYVQGLNASFEAFLKKDMVFLIFSCLLFPSIDVCLCS